MMNYSRTRCCTKCRRGPYADPALLECECDCHPYDLRDHQTFEVKKNLLEHAQRRNPQTAQQKIDRRWMPQAELERFIAANKRHGTDWWNREASK